MDKQK